MNSKMLATILLIFSSLKIINSSVNDAHNITFSIKPFNQTGLFTNMELQINGQFDFQNETYSTQTILDYSITGSKILDNFKTFPHNLSNEIINGQCMKNKESTIYGCAILLRQNSNSNSFNNLNFDYIPNNNSRENKQEFVNKLFEHYKYFEEQLYQNKYVEKIRNKCFQELSDFIWVFLPVSQNINIIHYFQGAKTMKEFEEIVNKTKQYKYPLKKQRGIDQGYQDLRFQHVYHYFLGDIQNQELASNNEPIIKLIKQIEEEYVFSENKKLIKILTDCLNENIHKYFQIIPKNISTYSDETDQSYNFTENSITFNSKDCQIQRNKQQNKYKYKIFKQKKEQQKIVYKILLYFGGDLNIISKKVESNLRNKILRIQYKQEENQYQQEETEICNEYLPLIKYSEENQKIDINLGKDIILDKTNQSITHEKKQQGIYFFTINFFLSNHEHQQIQTNNTIINEKKQQEINLSTVKLTKTQN
ncbi:hypothetical protein ABPG74_020699 [Tetrahymena malaccensis]